MGNHLGVSLGSKAMASDNQLVPKRAVVVNLSVKHHPDRPVFVGNRLGAGLKIDDAESLMSQPHTPVQEQTLVIRATVSKEIHHSRDLLWLDSLEVN